jgi:nucleotide-binding universal stress UspA family protein
MSQDVLPTTLLVPLDGTPHATVALPIAREMARHLRATLQVVFIGEPLLPRTDLAQKLGLSRRALRGAVLDQIPGPPGPAIVRLAHERRSQLIVMCTRTHVTDSHTPTELGSVAKTVVLHAPCPIVLVRPDRGPRPWALRHILLPHDGTPATAAAIHPAADLAGLAAAQLSVLHVATAGTDKELEKGTLTVPQYVDQPQHEWPAWTREFLDRLCCLGHLADEEQMQLFLAHGEPGEEIIRFAAEHLVDLIVLAWHGDLAAQRAVVLKTVLRGSPCPLLLLRISSEGGLT